MSAPRRRAGVGRRSRAQASRTTLGEEASWWCVCVSARISCTASPRRLGSRRSRPKSTSWTGSTRTRASWRRSFSSRGRPSGTTCRSLACEVNSARSLPSTTLLSSAVPQIRSPAASSIHAPWPRTERRRASTSPTPSTSRATAASLLCGTCRSSCTSHRYLAPLRRASRRQHRPDYGQALFQGGFEAPGLDKWAGVLLSQGAVEVPLHLSSAAPSLEGVQHLPRLLILVGARLIEPAVLLLVAEECWVHAR
mmetsp:Transcript_27593/g.63475  ORF Transcript_27593/g.63475 Transcript_27593/m.63475 type:complete len:252 (+) Transcript_27593:152-907(+)